MIRAAVLSAGAWARSAHLPALTNDPDVDLVAVSSPRSDAAAALAEEFGAGVAEEDWRRALDLGPDIVVVAGPPVTHLPQVLAALSAGAHVLVEKPFALNRDDARLMMEAAETAGRHLLVGFGWAASPVFGYARQAVLAGELGRLEQLSVHLAVNTRALLTGGRDGGWGGAGSEPGTYTDPAVSGGGTTVVTMSHQLGLACWIAGSHVSDLAAFTYPAGAELDLHSVVSLRYQHGAVGAVSAAPTQPYLTTPQWRLSLYGADGQIEIDTIRSSARQVGPDGRITDLPAALADSDYRAGAPTQALIECARGGAPPEGMNADLALHVVELTDAIYRSARLREVVSVD